MSASEPVFRTVKLAGAAYLVYLGVQSLVAALHGRRDIAGRGADRVLSPAIAFRQGLLSNLGNPKIAVFFASLLPQFVPGGSASFLGMFALGLLFCALGMAWLTLYSAAVHRLRMFVVGPVRRVLDAITGFVLIGLGLRLALDDT